MKKKPLILVHSIDTGGGNVDGSASCAESYGSVYSRIGKLVLHSRIGYFVLHRLHRNHSKTTHVGSVGA